jgi:homoserine O-succinyltransferase
VRCPTSSAQAGLDIRARRSPSDAADQVRLQEIGLVNNIPDAAFEATERQFVEVLGAAAGPNPVRLHLFSLERCNGGSP